MDSQLADRRGRPRASTLSLLPWQQLDPDPVRIHHEGFVPAHVCSHRLRARHDLDPSALECRHSRRRVFAFKAEMIEILPSEVGETESAARLVPIRL